MTKLRELLEQAMSDLDIYCHPNLDDLEEILPGVLSSAKLVNISHSTITSIKELDKDFEIKIEWSARCCAQYDYIYLPTLIVDSENPILAAKTWVNNQELERVKEKIPVVEKILKGLYARREALISCS